MEANKFCLSTRTSLNSKLSKPFRRYISLNNDEITKSYHKPKKLSEDPFDSMVMNGKSHPVLLPVLNKHRKNPSIPTFRSKDLPLTERSTQKSMSTNKSEFLLPKILNPNYLIHMKPKVNISSYMILEKTKEPEDLDTPCFSGDKDSKAEAPRVSKKVIKKNNQGLKICKNFNEISFGQ